MRNRTRFILGCLLALAAAIPAVATAAPRMPVGFNDDPSFRWRNDAKTNFDNAAQTDASIIRTTAYWSRIAPARPGNPTNPLDPGYHFEDLDQLVLNATRHDMTVLITIWGTPGWANGGQAENHAPTNMNDLQNFAQALAARYSGRYTALLGIPVYVGYFSVWNEPNLSEFLAPAYTNGKPSSPAVYAKMAAAAIAGIKAANPKAMVGVGETSPRGRQKPLGSSTAQDTIAPGLFAQDVAKAAPNLKFDAWAHHPYSGLGQGPNVKVAFPNVNLPQIPTFEKKLQQWFHRKFVKIWITEYGFETKPGQPKGVTLAQQAAYVKQTMADDRERPVRVHVHLVHLPGRPDEFLAQRARELRQLAQAGVRHVHDRRAGARHPQPCRLHQGQAVEPGHPRARLGSALARRPRRRARLDGQGLL